jgi:Mg2+/citrate symporter
MRQVVPDMRCHLADYRPNIPLELVRAGVLNIKEWSGSGGGATQHAVSRLCALLRAEVWKLILRTEITGLFIMLTKQFFVGEAVVCG